MILFYNHVFFVIHFVAHLSPFKLLSFVNQIVVKSKHYYTKIKLVVLSLLHDQPMFRTLVMYFSDKFFLSYQSVIII